MRPSFLHGRKDMEGKIACKFTCIMPGRVFVAYATRRFLNSCDDGRTILASDLCQEANYRGHWQDCDLYNCLSRAIA